MSCHGCGGEGELAQGDRIVMCWDCGGSGVSWISQWDDERVEREHRAAQRHKHANAQAKDWADYLEAERQRRQEKQRG